MPKIVRLTLSDDGLTDSSNDSGSSSDNDNDNERTDSSMSSMETGLTAEGITDAERVNSGGFWQNSGRIGVLQNRRREKELQI